MKIMEEEKQNSEKCRRWEEETYWKHFHSVHFFQILPTNFHNHLKLPTKFTANEMAKLPEKVILKDPNGIIWHVNLLKNDINHVMLTGDGWIEFVKAYSLQKKDLLIFKYDRTDKCLEVLFFDQTNSCEREASYFVRRCEQTQSIGGFDGQAKSKSHEYVIYSHTDYDSDDEWEEDEQWESNKDKDSLKVNDSTRKEAPSNYLRKRKSFTDGFDKDERDKRRATIEDELNLEQHNSPKVNGSTSEKARSHSVSRDRNRDKKVPSNKQSKKRMSSNNVTEFY